MADNGGGWNAPPPNSGVGWGRAMQVVHLIRASTSRTKATLIRASALVSFGLESFEEDDTKNLRGDVYQANASVVRLSPFLKRGRRTASLQLFGTASLNQTFVITLCSHGPRDARHVL